MCLVCVLERRRNRQSPGRVYITYGANDGQRSTPYLYCKSINQSINHTRRKFDFPTAVRHNNNFFLKPRLEKKGLGGAFLKRLHHEKDNSIACSLFFFFFDLPHTQFPWDFQSRLLTLLIQPNSFRFHARFPVPSAVGPLCAYGAWANDVMGRTGALYSSSSASSSSSFCCVMLLLVALPGPLPLVKRLEVQGWLVVGAVLCVVLCVIIVEVAFCRCKLQAGAARMMMA